jgi:hypothetical protein
MYLIPPEKRRPKMIVEFSLGLPLTIVVIVGDILFV